MGDGSSNDLIIVKDELSPKYIHDINMTANSDDESDQVSNMINVNKSPPHVLHAGFQTAGFKAHSIPKQMRGEAE